MKKDENARVTVYPMATTTNGAGYCRKQKKESAPWRIRTSDLQIRSLPLYPD